MIGEKDDVILRIGKAEALVLFELLAEFDSQQALTIPDDAVRLSLMRLHGALESELVEPFDADYRKLLAEAQAQLIEEFKGS